jgi:hypothetical protein
LHELPENRQETVARAILDYASHDDGVYHLTDEERAEVRAGLAEIERGDIELSPILGDGLMDQAAAIWA